MWRVANPIRSGFAGAASSPRYDVSCAGVVYGSPGIMPASTSSTAAESRTLRATTGSQTRPASPGPGAIDTRARDGFRPNSPQQIPGIQIEPPPSFACAIGAMPAATAHAEPPDEPPEPRFGSYGLRVGGHASGSAAGALPRSLVFALPAGPEPARC